MLRRAGTYAMLAAATTAIVAATKLGAPRSWNTTRVASLALAWAAASALVAALAIGPLNVLRGRRNPISQNLRRDLGIWTALTSLAHTWFGLHVHRRGHMVEYFVYPPDKGGGLRFDGFGTANLAGAIAALIALVLLATSNDRSLRLLGARAWKAVQRFSYGLLLLSILHAIAYQLIEKRSPILIGVLAVAFASVGLLQGIGAGKVLRRAGPAATESDSSAKRAS
jgi:sulfoxide reductase heme-binding subunit YedZ